MDTQESDLMRGQAGMHAKSDGNCEEDLEGGGERKRKFLLLGMKPVQDWGGVGVWKKRKYS